MQVNHNTPENGANPQKSRILKKAESLTEAEAQKVEFATEKFSKLSGKGRKLFLEEIKNMISRGELS